MKVICINDKWVCYEPHLKHPVFGGIYTVIRQKNFEFNWANSLYYFLEEFEAWALSSNFAPLSDIDEMELIAERELVKN